MESLSGLPEKSISKRTVSSFDVDGMWGSELVLCGLQSIFCLDRIRPRAYMVASAISPGRATANKRSFQPPLLSTESRNLGRAAEEEPQTTPGMGRHRRNSWFGANSREPGNQRRLGPSLVGRWQVVGRALREPRK